MTTPIYNRVHGLHIRVSDSDAVKPVMEKARLHAESVVWFSVWVRVRNQIRFVMRDRWNQ